MNRVWIIVCVAFCASAMQKPASAEILLTEDFESTSLNAWPGGWTGVANVNTNPSANKVVVDLTDAGNQVLQLHGAIGSSWAAIGYRPADFTDAFTISMRVYNGSEDLNGAHPLRAHVGLVHGQGWEWQTHPGVNLFHFLETDTVNGVDGTALLTDYESERWYEIGMACTWEGYNLSVNYTIDGVNLGTQSRLLDWSSSTPWMTPDLLDNIGISAQEGTAYYDNIQVTSSPVPEPTSLVLWSGLGLMGLIAARRRRKA